MIKLFTAQPTIFVQIASYRDPECQWTVKDLFEKAAHPGRIHIGICWQFDPDQDQDCFKEPYPFPKQVRECKVKASDSKGVCWARYEAQKLYKNEDYVLMIDSHMRFVHNWDELMIKELEECGSEKPVLTSYPPGYTPPDKLKPHAKPTVLRLKQTTDQGDIRGEGIVLEKFPKHALRGAFLAAGFLFSKGKLVKEVPYDPYMYFNQEEISLAARMYTHGWDIFHPARILLYHYYTEVTGKPSSGRSLHWEDNKNWEKWQNRARKRFRHLVGNMNSKDDDVTKGLKKYGLGKRRSIKEFGEYAGIDFKKMQVLPRGLKAEFIEDLPSYTQPAASTKTATKAAPETAIPEGKIALTAAGKNPAVAKGIYKVLEAGYSATDPARKLSSLVMFSGGLDSVALLANLLTATRHDVHVHHIEIDNFENRMEAEINAVEMTLEYCRKNFRPFTYSKSRNEFHLGLGGGYDVSLAMFTAGRVYTARGGGIDVVWTGHIALGTDDLVQASAVFHAGFINRLRVPEWLRPLTRMAKKDIYESIPEELAKLCWSCRTPVYKDGAYHPCGECHACKSIIQAGGVLGDQGGGISKRKSKAKVPERNQGIIFST